MKKIIIMIVISLFTLQFLGCSKAEIERSPVIIEETPNQDNPSYNTPNPTEATGDEDEIPDKIDTPVNSSDPQSNTNPNEDVNKDEIIPIIIQLEGMNEIINTKIIQSALGYSIQYDIDRLTHKFDNNEDSFIAQNPNPDLYPYVYLNVKRIDNVNLKDFSEQWLKSVSTESNSKLEKIDNTSINDYNTLHYYLVTGKEWNSSVRNYYMIEGNQSIYFIETQYFIEAEEGFGARLKAMLNTFQIN